jgi:hypothetical protein
VSLGTGPSKKLTSDDGNGFGASHALARKFDKLSNLVLWRQQCLQQLLKKFWKLGCQQLEVGLAVVSQASG